MINVETTVRIAELIEGQLPLGEEVITGLRSAFPEMHFTYCLDDDIVTGKPVLEREAFNVYLIDGREHCLCLTNDHDVATGLVVAEKYDEE